MIWNDVGKFLRLKNGTTFKETPTKAANLHKGKPIKERYFTISRQIINLNNELPVV